MITGDEPYRNVIIADAIRRVKMKTSAIIFNLIFLVSCGQAVPMDDEQTSVSAKASPDTVRRATALASKSSLGDCNVDNESQLVYVMDEKAFYVCFSESWTEIDIKGQDGENGKNGENGKDSVSITKIIKYNPVTEDICTSESYYDLCVFRGAQIILYSNGDFYISAGFSYSYLEQVDTDTYMSFPSWYYRGEGDGGFLLLTDHGNKSGDSGLYSVWFVFKRDTEQAGLVMDTNQNYVLDDDDELMMELQPSTDP